MVKKGDSFDFFNKILFFLVALFRIYSFYRFVRDQIQFEDHLTAMALHGIATVGFKILEGVSSAEQPVSEILLQESARWHN